MANYGQLGFAGWCGFNLAACHDGLGRHQWNVSALRMIHVAKVRNMTLPIFEIY